MHLHTFAEIIQTNMEMRIDLRRLNDDLRFEGTNGSGNKVTIDGGVAPAGLRPMELLLSALASCAAFDLEHILRKQRQSVSDVRVTVKGTRADAGAPRPFQSIHMHFSVEGHVDEEKLKRAVTLSVEKYCSVGATLRKKTEVTYSSEAVATSN